MLTKLLAAWSLLAICVVIHAVGVTLAVDWVRRRGPSIQRFWAWTRLFIVLAGWIVMLHGLEIVAWGFLYSMTGALPELPSAVYFSMVTYTTTGYGDIVLPPEWRLVGAIEALTGILMFGWSTGVLFAVVSKMFMRADHSADLET